MVIPSRLFSFWEVAEVVVVDVVTGKEGGVGEAEDVRTAPPGQPPHPRAWPHTSKPTGVSGHLRWDTV